MLSRDMRALAAALRARVDDATLTEPVLRLGLARLEDLAVQAGALEAAQVPPWERPEPDLSAARNVVRLPVGRARRAGGLPPRGAA